MSLQLDIFTQSPYVKHSGEAVTGESLRDMGMKKAEDHANEKVENWSEQAYVFLKKFIQIRNESFQTELFRLWAENNGLQKPPHARAYGGVITRASKGKIKDGQVIEEPIIEWVKFESTNNPKAHKTPASVWKRR